MRAVRLASVLGDDVDYAIDRVRSPDGSTRSANHLYPVDIGQHRVLHLPVGSGQQRRVNRTAVDEHQHRPRQATSETADTDRPLIAVNLRDLDARRQPKRVWNGSHTGAADVLSRDDVYGCGASECIRGALGCGGDFDIGELREAQVLEFFNSLLVILSVVSTMSRECEARDEKQNPGEIETLAEQTQVVAL